MQCTCGTQITSGTFCTNCGKRVVDPTQSAATFPAPTQPMAPSNYGTVNYSSTSQNSQALSTVSFILAAISLLFLPILFGPAAIGFAIAAKSKKESRGDLALGLSIGAMVLGMILGALFWSSFVYQPQLSFTGYGIHSPPTVISSIIVYRDSKSTSSSDIGNVSIFGIHSGAT